MPFEARALPEMIEVGGEIVAGPFCVHCGYPFTLHGPSLQCRARPNPILRPICSCHEVREVPITKGRGRGLTELRIVRI